MVACCISYVAFYNVAVTRAREKVILVCSIRSSELDLSGTHAPGVLALHGYLDYAERGIGALLYPHGKQGEPESPFEKEVAAEIRALGHSVLHQVGCSGFRIDIGVVDPAKPGRFILGVECDGATYHSANTARDRDRLRQEVLERFGWRIHRVWSRDWVMRREIELRRLREAIEKALGSRDNPGAKKSYGKDGNQSKFVTERNPGPNDNKVYPWVFPYKVWRPNGKLSIESEEGKISNSEITKMLNQIVDVEGPLHIELALHRLASNLGFQRVGSRVREAAEHSIKTLIKEERIKKFNKFLWPNRGDFNLTVRQPVIQEKESFRTIKIVPPEEIELAIKKLVHAAMSITEADIIREVARIFGLDRVSSNIYDRLKKILAQMISRGELIAIGERISIPGKE